MPTVVGATFSSDSFLVAGLAMEAGDLVGTGGTFLTDFSDFRGAFGAGAFLSGASLDMAVLAGFSSLLTVFLTAGRAAALAAALGWVTALADLLDF